MTVGLRLRTTLRSTSFKLLTFFVISCLSIILLVQSVSDLIADYSRPKIESRHQNRAHYAQLLAEELEHSLDRNQESRRLEHELSIGSRIETLETSHTEPVVNKSEFATSNQIPSFADIEKSGVRRVWTPDLKAGEYQGVEFIIVTLKAHRYLFLFRSAPFQELQLKWLSPMTALIVLILFANFILIRWLFRPVAWLSDGIRKLGEGDFDVQVPSRANDELGDLALSFNETVWRVRQIVESKRQLLLDVSHELRSPLTRMRVALELDGPKAKEHIRKNILILESMIHDLLESARLDYAHTDLQAEQVNLTEILKDIATTVDFDPPGVVFNTPDYDLLLQGHRKQIETCIKNVLDNAVKYSRQQTQPVQVSVEKNGEVSLRVHVRDFGLGVPQSEREMIFEPFYRVDKSRVHETGGYGLGLNLCRKIMLAHGGQILVNSPNSGEGSVFTLEFPITKSPR